MYTRPTALIDTYLSTDANDAVKINWTGGGVGEVRFYSPRAKEYPLDK